LTQTCHQSLYANFSLALKLREEFKVKDGRAKSQIWLLFGALKMIQYGDCRALPNLEGATIQKFKTFLL